MNYIFMIDHTVITKKMAAAHEAAVKRKAPARQLILIFVTAFVYSINIYIVCPVEIEISSCL